MRQIVCLLIVLCACVAHGTDYYVETPANGGSDSNDGLTAGTPKATIAAATALTGNGTHRILVGHTGGGTFLEKPTESSSGSSYSAMIQIIGGGTNGATKTTCRGFTLSGDYIRVTRFEITHDTGGLSDGINVSGNFNVIEGNWIHNTTDTCIEPDSAHGLTIRDNIMYMSGSPANDSGAGTKIIGDSGASSTNVLIEWNMMRRNTDYISPRGSVWLCRGNVMGPCITNDFGDPHVDGYQFNAQFERGWFMWQWHHSNSVAQAHFVLLEAPVSGRNRLTTFVQNLSYRSGDQLWVQLRDATNNFLAHNTVGQIGWGPQGGPGSSGFIYVWDDVNGASVGNHSYNNIYTNVTTAGGAVYTESGGGDITHSHDIVFPLSSDLVNGSNGDLETDPMFTDWEAVTPTGFMHRSGAPGIDSGTRLASCNETNSGTQIRLTDIFLAQYFHDGTWWQNARGMKIYVAGNNNLTITAVDYATGTITLSSAITCTNNSPVGYAYQGSGPDRGCYDYRASGYSVTATYIVSGNDYTVSVNDTAIVECVDFYQNGVFVSRDSASPFTATIAGGGVTMYARPNYPSPEVAFLATQTLDPAGDTKYRNGGRPSSSVGVTP